MDKKHSIEKIKNACLYKLEIKFRKGKEFNGWFKVDEKKLCRITIPKKKSRKDIATPTYKSMAIQLHLDVDEFNNLVDCTISKDEFTKMLLERIS